MVSLVSLMMNNGADEDSSEGCDRTKASVWFEFTIPPRAVCPPCRRPYPHPLLVMATSISFLVGAIRQHAPHPERHFPHPTSDGYQLLVLVPCWLHLPICPAEEEFRLVEQVQLRHECCVG